MDTCPHCGEEIARMDGYFSASNYKPHFDIECPHCQRPIKACVVRTFELTALQDSESPWICRIVGGVAS
jgi:hypothetical protein